MISLLLKADSRPGDYGFFGVNISRVIGCGGDGTVTDSMLYGRCFIFQISRWILLNPPTDPFNSSTTSPVTSPLMPPHVHPALSILNVGIISSCSCFVRHSRPVMDTKLKLDTLT